MFAVPVCLLNVTSIIAQVVDPYYNNVYSLLHFNGVDGGTTFYDEKSISWTNNNSVQTKQDIIKYGTAAGKFNGSNYLSSNIGTGSTATFDFSNDFTFECWFYLEQNPSDRPAILCCDGAYSVHISHFLGFNSSGGLRLGLAYNSDSTTFLDLNGSTTVTQNAWHHIAATKNGQDVYLFLDGVLEASVSGVAAIKAAQDRMCYIGQYYDGGYRFTGRIDDLRFTKNVARYTENFTPLAIQFTDKLTWYYGLQSKFTSNIADMTSKVWTAHGNASVSSGALQLDGTGDYIDTPYHADCHFTTGQDVTIRFKSKVSSFSSDRRVLLTTRRDVSGSINNWAIYANSSNGVEFKIWLGGGASSILLDASWASSFTFGIEFELSLERKGMIWRLYINGSQVGSPFTQTSNYTVNTSSLLSIGTEFNTDNSSDTSRDLNGTLRSLQIIKGVALSDGKSNTTYLTYTDTFDSNTISNYTEYSDSSGNWTISNGYLSASTGNQSILTPSDASFTNGEISCIISQADDSGMVLRLLDNNNYYLVTIRDNSASNPSVRNQLYLYKRVGGNYSIIGSANIPLFTRNTPTKMTFYAKGDNLIVKVKDIIYINVTDSTFTSSGKCGVRMHGSGGPHQYESFTYPIS